MTKKIVALTAACSIGLAACSTPEGKELLDNVGLGDIRSQGCAIGGLGGAIAGGVIGNQLDGLNGGAIGAALGGSLGGLIGCSVGDIIEERRANAASDADFYDEQIALADRKAKELSRDNADLRERIASNEQVIVRLQSQSGALEERRRQASDAYDVNEEALESYEALNEQLEEEIDVQETVLAEIRGVSGQDDRARTLEREIADLKAQNQSLEENISALSAQNNRIGEFR